MGVSRTVLVALTCAVACLVVGADGQEEASTGLAYWEGRTSINLCTSEYTPMVLCVDRDPADYGGYEIMLFRRVQKALGWPDSQINFTCTDWDTMMNSLSSGDGFCDMAVAGISITTDNFDMGLTLTLPTVSSGYKIMTMADNGSVSLFAFMSAFSWELWLAILLTCIAIGIILWLVDRWAIARGTPHPADPPLATMQRQIIRALGRPMQTEEAISPSAAGSLITLVFSGMCLILVTLFTANTAANLTATRFKNLIKGLADLPGKRVGTWEGYIPDLERKGIKSIGYPWNSLADEEAMFQALISGEVQALVLDSPFLEYSSGTRCEFRLLEDIWGESYQAVAFPKGFNNTMLLKEYNNALLSISEAGGMDELVKDIIRPQASCKNRGVSENEQQVTFQDVAGLWVVLGASIGVACMLVIAHQMTKRGVHKVKQTTPYQASARKVRGAMERLGSSGRRWAPTRVAASVRTAEDKTGLAGSDKSEGSSELCSPPLV